MIKVRNQPVQRDVLSFIPRRITNWKAALPLAVLLAVGGLAFLSIVASQQAFSNADIQLAQWIHSISFPSLDAILGPVNFLTDAHAAIATWLIATAFFVLRGRPLEALAVFSIPGVWIAGESLSRVVGGTFPSGHTTHAVSFYGLLAFLTLNNLRRGHLRVAVPALAVSIIGLTSLGRVYVGDHLPSDVLGSYLLGFIGLVTIAWVYSSVKEDRLHLPRFLRKQSAPEATDGVKIARSIASTVYLDARMGTATKVYNPPRLVRALYWLAFQAPFPYQHRKDALEAAAAIRKIAGLLTRHQFGYDVVAAVREIRNGGNAYQFVTEFIPGTSPASNGEIESTLSDLYSYFQEVGLPTWQVAPGNPHAYSNLIRTPQGNLKLIDLESALISAPPWKQLRPLIRDGHFPAFDDVDFVQLHGYVQDHVSELTESLGPAGFAELEQAIESAELSTQSWKESEPRIWGHIARRIYRILDVSRFLTGIRRQLDSAEAVSTSFLNSAVGRWEREGRIDRRRSAALRHAVSTPELKPVLRHLGVHLILSLALRFPVGSMARFAWVVAFRVKARYDFVRGRITRDKLQAERSLHSVRVMLISLIPGLGTIAYCVSGTMINAGLTRALLDQIAYKLPFRLYHRLGLVHITAPAVPQPAARE